MESIKILKTHPFFTGVNFEEVSLPNYTGILPLMQARFAELGVKNDQEEEFKTAELPTMDTQMYAIDENKVVLKGNLCKKNRWMVNQVRFFMLYENGDLRYYKDQHEYKGTIKVGLSSKPRKVDKVTILLTCEVKKKEYKIF